MKKQFEVIKNRPKVILKLTRDSVCAGDDSDAPHVKNLETFSFIDPNEFIKNIASGYLPYVAGFGHSWDCFLNKILIGRISKDEVNANINNIIYLDSNNVHFQYNVSEN